MPFGLLIRNDTIMEKAIFAAGCFWGVEKKFRNIEGVEDVVSGYTGGTVENPTYEQVCTGTTGHAEAVEVTFEPDKVSYRELLDAFWEMHDPTTKNRQGPDVGHQYRSSIFYVSDEQRDAAEESKKDLQKSGKYSGEVVTEIESAGPFYKAEEYHQQYLRKHGQASCSM